MNQVFFISVDYTLQAPNMSIIWKPVIKFWFPYVKIEC